MKTLIFMLCVLLIAVSAEAQGHRRARHFNPAQMVTPAKTALYANWQTGFVDGDAVGTFAARAGTTNTQTASSTARPTFKTGIIGGQSVLRFNGSTNEMTGTWQNVTAWEFAIVLIPKDLSNFNSVVGALNGGNINHRQLYLDYRGGANINIAISNPSGTYHEMTSARTVNVAAVEFFRFGSGTLYNWQSGTSRSGSIPTSGVTTMGIGDPIGANNGEFDLGAVVVFDANLDESNRKRLAHSLAFTFKISCK